MSLWLATGRFRALWKQFGTASIRDDVRLSRPEASDREVEQALRHARLWEWTRALPDGLDTLVGEEGRELSGGQRQRIVLARALLADTPVLVLDEPAAHLDPAVRALVADVLSAARGRTVLLITHRTEGLDLVDRVVTLRAQVAGAGAWNGDPCCSSACSGRHRRWPTSPTAWRRSPARGT